jgi:ABC-type transporter Mla subunit MlaD
MSQVRDKRQNNVRAGVFVTITFILALVVFSILTNAWSRMFSSLSTYHAVFSIRDGVGALSAGSKVRLGGVLVGSIQQVTPRSDRNAPTSVIDVFFTIDNNYDLYENATVHARAGLLGSTAWLSVSNVGSGVKATASTELAGTTETMVTQLLGSDAEINISKSLDSLRKLSEALTDDGGAFNVLLGSREAEGLKSVIDSARASLSSIKSILETTEAAWPEWESSISTILADSKGIPAQLNQTLLQIQEVVQDVRADVLPSVEQSLDSLKSTLGSLESISKTYQEESPEWAASVSKIIENAKQISLRAKAAIDEISASPWRLLYRPTDREIAYEQLNAASWQLQSALTDLRISAEALEIASKSSTAPEEASAIAVSLSESAEAFEKALKAIEQRMNDDFPNRK